MRISDWTSDGCSSDLSVFISPTAARVLDAAQILIQNNGYNGFSYEDLSRMVGLRKPSLHHHFPKKEDLGATVVERYTERFVLALNEIENTHADAAEQIQAYVSLFIDTYGATQRLRSEERTSELQSLMRISSAVFCWKKTKQNKTSYTNTTK